MVEYAKYFEKLKLEIAGIYDSKVCLLSKFVRQHSTSSNTSIFAMLILALFFQLHYLCTAVRASAIPSKANSFTLPGHELSVATPPSEHTTDLEVFVPRTSTTEIAEIGKHHALAVFDKRDKTVWVAGLEAAGKIGEAACKAGFWSCAVFCISAVVIAYFAYQYFTNDSPSTK